MNKLIFNDATFDVAVNGITSSNDTFVAKLVTDDFDLVESKVPSTKEITQTLFDGTKVSTYKGFTKLISINKLFNQVVDYQTETREETRVKKDAITGEVIVDPDTGEEEMELYLVTDEVPVYANVLVVTLFQPTLEDIIADQGEQITEIQEVLAELM